MSRLSACCSMMWAHQPVMRAATKIGVYCGTGMPIVKYVMPQGKSTLGWMFFLSSMIFCTCSPRSNHLTAGCRRTSPCLFSAIFAPEPVQDARAVVAVLVDAVAEAHELALGVEGVLHPLVDLRACRSPLAHVLDDLLEHLHRHLVGAAVQRALERGDRRRVTAPCMSLSVPAMTRLVKVLALNSCSA